MKSIKNLKFHCSNNYYFVKYLFHINKINSYGYVFDKEDLSDVQNLIINKTEPEISDKIKEIIGVLYSADAEKKKRFLDGIAKTIQDEKIKIIGDCYKKATPEQKQMLIDKIFLNNTPEFILDIIMDTTGSLKLKLSKRFLNEDYDKELKSMLITHLRGYKKELTYISGLYEDPKKVKKRIKKINKITSKFNY